MALAELMVVKKGRKRWIMQNRHRPEVNVYSTFFKAVTSYTCLPIYGELIIYILRKRNQFA